MKKVYLGCFDNRDGMNKLVAKHLYLKSKDYKVINFFEAEALQEAITQELPEILIISRIMRNAAGKVFSGFAVAAQLRFMTKKLPMIMFSPLAKSEIVELEKNFVCTDPKVFNINAYFQLPLDFDKLTDKIIEFTT